MRVDVISIFCAYLEPLRLSLVGRSIDAGIVDLHLHELRDFTHDRHRTVDDAPYGGGPGMLMRPEPWGEALTAILGISAGAADEQPESVRSRHLDQAGAVRLIVPTPSGRPFTQGLAQQWSRADRLIFACGRYEGIDARVPAWAAGHRFSDGAVTVEEVSIGDYVLAGAEAAVLVMVEAVVRLLPGVLGNDASHGDDSFAPGAMARLLEGPGYTRPPIWNGLAVPDVLLSGNHAAVARWRHEQAVARTRLMRPDLLAGGSTADAPRADTLR